MTITIILLPESKAHGRAHDRSGMFPAISLCLSETATSHPATEEGPKSGHEEYP